jgi:hypoxanthine phosphoribosyltransferase
MTSQTTEQSTVKIQGLEFELLYTPEQIRQAVKRVASEISHVWAGKDPLCIAILNGAFMFTADLMRELSFDPELAFVRVSSYRDVQSSGTIDRILGLNCDIHGRDILIIEDIVDTGHTISHLHEWFMDHGADSVTFAAMLYKEEAYIYDIPIDFVGLTIANRFVVGYGLDYNGYGRSLPAVYMLKQEASHV